MKRNIREVEGFKDNISFDIQIYVHEDGKYQEIPNSEYSSYLIKSGYRFNSKEIYKVGVFNVEVNILLIL